jgi:hypothetical protein
MWIGALVLLSSSLLNQKPAPVYADVFIGAKGPYRFLVDTGAQTSLIDEKLAAGLKLQPQYRVEIVTQHSSRSSPALKMRDLRIGDKRLAETELVFQDLENVRRSGIPIRGLLGISALAGHSFTITPKDARLELDPSRPEGEAVPYYLLEGRIALKARMGSEDLFLALDSGGHHVVLFRTPAAMAKTKPVNGILGTLEGARSVVPTTWTEPMSFSGGIRVKTLPAAMVKRDGAEVDGLLPASAFRSIYIDPARGEAVLSVNSAAVSDSRN